MQGNSELGAIVVAGIVNLLLKPSVYTGMVVCTVAPGDDRQVWLQFKRAPTGGTHHV